MMKRKIISPGWAVCVLLLPLLFTLTVLFPDGAGRLTRRIVMPGVLSCLPLETCKTDGQPVTAKSGTDIQPAGIEKKESDTATLKAAESTAAKDEKKEKTEKKKDTQKEDELQNTDEDIRLLMEEYEKKSKKDKKDGGISEEDLHESGKTDSYGNVHVKNTNKTQIDIAAILSQKAELSVEKEKKKPAVLIYHTHTTEAYQILERSFYAVGAKSRSSSPALNMVRVGDAVCQRLEKAGFSVIHDTQIYDSAYTGAYYRSYDAAKEWMEKYPSIQITLDIHRDAIQYDTGTKVKPVCEINGKKAAQIMIISGCQEEGNGIEDFPEWRKNLVFALQLQQQLENDYRGLTRPVFFCPRDYNMNLTPCSLLLEVGTDANTLDEAVYTGKMLGESLAALMENYISE